MSLKVGCDLEYIVRSPKGYIPAGLLPITGVKGKPDLYLTGGIEVDCCAVELTVPPAETENMFVSNIMAHLAFTRAKYKQYGEIEVRPSYTFSKVALSAAPFATQMGCDPDYNVWTNTMNPRPKAKGGFRSFGGHVHIEGADKETIKACDLTLGMWSVLTDLDTERKKLYGKAGAYRRKPYGMEYRVLSNFWCDTPDYIRRVFQLTQLARELRADGLDEIIDAVGGPDKIQDVINKSDRPAARAILSSVGGYQ